MKESSQETELIDYILILPDRHLDESNPIINCDFALEMYTRLNQSLKNAFSIPSLIMWVCYKMSESQVVNPHMIPRTRVMVKGTHAIF